MVNQRKPVTYSTKHIEEAFLNYKEEIASVLRAIVLNGQKIDDDIFLAGIRTCQKLGVESSHVLAHIDVLGSVWSASEVVLVMIAHENAPQLTPRQADRRVAFHALAEALSPSHSIKEGKENG